MPDPVEKPTKQAKTYRSVPAVQVIDGETLKVRLASGSKTVRLVGIDTPETKKPGPAVECGGKDATAYMHKLALRGGKGRVVSLTSD